MSKLGVTCLAVLCTIGWTVGQYADTGGRDLSHLYRHNLAARGQLASQFSALRSDGHTQAGSHQPRAYGGASRSSYGQGGQEDYSEPANYEFSYEVSAPENDLSFGHEETRRDDLAQGRYHVLLPDGRRQVVEYTADQGGYMPTISYEESNGYEARSNGYGGNGNGYGGNGNVHRGSGNGYGTGGKGSGGFGNRFSARGNGIYGSAANGHQQHGLGRYSSQRPGSSVY